MNKQWSQIIGLVLVALFMSTLLTIKLEPNDVRSYVKEQVSKYSYWEKYELNGMRTVWNDDLRVKFWNRNNGLEAYYDVRYNDLSDKNVPYLVRYDSALVMNNTFFFDDSNVTMVQAYLIGENDMLVCPYDNSAKFDTTYIYLKRRLPYQY